MLSLERRKFTLQTYKSTHDSHTAVVYLKKMIVFGGYVNGVKSNDVYEFDRSHRSWTKVVVNDPNEIKRRNNIYDKYKLNPDGTQRNAFFLQMAPEIGNLATSRSLDEDGNHQAPCPRTGHTAVVHSFYMYIFGGCTADNRRLNDTWKLDLKTYHWREIAVGQFDRPKARSGHSASVYKHHMMIFGGLHQVKVELNDMHVFNFKTEKWVFLYKNHQSIQDQRQITTNSNFSSILQDQGQYRTPTQPFLTIRPDDLMPDYPGSIMDRLKTRRKTMYDHIGLTPS